MQAGLTGNVLLVSSSIQYVINVAMTVPALIYIDRWGRRNTLVIGALLMMIWLFVNVGLMASYGRPAPPGGVNNTAEARYLPSLELDGRQIRPFPMLTCDAAAAG